MEMVIRERGGGGEEMELGKSVWGIPSACPIKLNSLG